MSDYYAILGVDEQASPSEIKSAFRKRAKTLHPDLVREPQESGEIGMRILIKAYKTLIDPILKQEYDFRQGRRRRKTGFTYRDYLRKRAFDPICQSRLIHFELCHDNEDDAIRIFEDFFQRYNYDLTDYMEREDYMDCAFLIAEEYCRRGDFLKSYELLKTIVMFEREQAYFQHFFEEVIFLLRTITCYRLPGILPATVVLDYLQEMVGFDFSRQHNAFFLKKIAEIHLALGDKKKAAEYLLKGLSLDGKLSGVKKLKEKVGL